MKINTTAIKELIDQNFRGNISWFADEIGVDKAYMSAIIKKQKDLSSNKVMIGIITYCKKHNLNEEKYIFF